MPVQTIRRSQIAKLQTAAPFDGTWFHSTDVKDKIFAGGWKPDLVKNTIYGAAVYLARGKWSAGHRDVIECVLDLTAAHGQSAFPNPWEQGREEKHLMWHLKHQNVVPGSSAGPGTSSLNRKIAKHFLGRSVSAINFVERGIEILAIYDPGCLRVVEEDPPPGGTAEHT